MFCTILKNSLVRGLAVDCEANRPSVLILNWSSTSPALSLLSTAPLMQVRYTQSHSVSDCISPSVTTTSLGCIREKGGGVHIDGYLSKASIHVFCLLNITECDGLYYARLWDFHTVFRKPVAVYNSTFWHRFGLIFSAPDSQFWHFVVINPAIQNRCIVLLEYYSSTHSVRGKFKCAVSE